MTLGKGMALGLLVIAAGLAVAFGLVLTRGAEGGVRANAGTGFAYSAKFACGLDVTDDQQVVPGEYTTAINVHNPQAADVHIYKKAVLAPREPDVGDPSPFKEIDLPSDAAFEIDCPDIFRILEHDCAGDVSRDGDVDILDQLLVLGAEGTADPREIAKYDLDLDGDVDAADTAIVTDAFGAVCDGLFKGFAVLFADQELDVWGVYTSGQIVNGTTAGNGVSEDIEVVPFTIQPYPPFPTPTPTSTPTDTPTATDTPTDTPTPTVTNTPTPTPQDPTFSISRTSGQSPAPVDPADLAVITPPGVPPPTIVYPCPALLPPGLNCGSLGGVPPWDDVNALSLGADFTLAPPDPANPNAFLYFSVAPGATGAAGTGVNNETIGCAAGPEPEADEFGSAGTGGNYQYFDGDGVPSCANPPAPAMGLLEPPVAVTDDLDAVDAQNFAAKGHPIYVSLDSISPTITFPPGILSAGDIFVDLGLGIAGWYAPAGALGLDTLGWNTDDIDALCVNDADGDNVFSAADTVWFSLAAGSASLGIAGDSPADVFAAPFTPGVPVRTAAQMGLLAGDELNALKCYEEPPCVDREGTTSCEDPINDPDDDGCVDAEEQVGALPPKPGATGAYDPTAWYDYYDVPVPAKSDVAGANGTRNKVINIGDVLAVLFYVGTVDNGPPNGNGVDYDSIKGVDTDGDTTNDIPPPLHQIEEGVKYDRSPSAAPNPPWEVGPPDGVINIGDVLANLAQVGLDCSGPP